MRGISMSSVRTSGLCVSDQIARRRTDRRPGRPLPCRAPASARSTASSGRSRNRRRSARGCGGRCHALQPRPRAGVPDRRRCDDVPVDRERPIVDATATGARRHRRAGCRTRLDDRAAQPEGAIAGAAGQPRAAHHVREFADQIVELVARRHARRRIAPAERVEQRAAPDPRAASTPAIPVTGPSSKLHGGDQPLGDRRRRGPGSSHGSTKAKKLRSATVPTAPAIAPAPAQTRAASAASVRTSRRTSGLKGFSR